MRRLSLQGTPRAMGLAHGEALRDPIRELAAIRMDLLRRRMPGYSSEAIEALCLEQVAVLARHSALHDEFQGIAQGSGLTPQELLVLNNYTDMRDFDNSDEGCSTFSARYGHHHVFGQTWDMHASARPYVLHLSRGGDAPCEVLTLTGCLALAGVNADNLGVFINNLNCTQTANGLMWPALVQGMLFQPTARAAANFLRNNLPCSGHNYLLCGEDTTINTEATGQALDVTFDAPRGAVFHTNHYLGRLRSHERVSRRSLTTQPRYAALHRFFDRYREAAADLPLLAGNLCSASGENSVCVPFTGADASLTCGGMLYDATRQCGVIFAGTFDEHEHSEFHFPASTVTPTTKASKWKLP